MLLAQVVFIILKTVQPFTTTQRKMNNQKNSTLGIDLTPQNRETVTFDYNVCLSRVMCFSGTFQGDRVTGQ